MDIVSPAVEAYVARLLDRHTEPILAEMEAEAASRGFPIVGRHVGVTFELLARAIGAQRMIELGSGFGYSAYWFARAVGERGEVHCTDGDAENARKAMDYLSRAGLSTPVVYHVGEAIGILRDEVEGTFDLVYCDIDKGGYPDAWRAARDRIRVGGLYVCDNVLWYGRVTDAEVEDERPELTEAIREHNRLIAEDDRYLSSVLPIRDGVTVAMRLA